MSGRQARAARARKHSLYAQFCRYSLDQCRRALGLRRRDIRRRVRALPAYGAARFQAKGRQAIAYCYGQRVEFGLPGRPFLLRWPV